MTRRRLGRSTRTGAALPAGPLAGLLAKFLAGLLALGLTGAAGAMPSDLSPLAENEDYRRARALIRAGEHAAAIPVLNDVNRIKPDEPDVLNWLGFCHRKIKNYPVARIYYDRALALDPNHLGALEYLGELFVETGDLPAARARLDRLVALCGDCEERQDLEAAIRRAGGAR